VGNARPARGWFDHLHQHRVHLALCCRRRVRLVEYPTPSPATTVPLPTTTVPLPTTTVPQPAPTEAQPSADRALWLLLGYVVVLVVLSILVKWWLGKAAKVSRRDRLS
jgi:hypothetical protein